MVSKMPRQPEKLEQLAEQLKTLSETLATEEASDLSAHRVKRIRQTIAEAYDKLRKVVEDLDPIKHPGFVFEPSNPNIAGRIIGITLIAQPRKPLTAIDKFYGSGVYALYYNGDFHSYRGISKKEHPMDKDRVKGMADQAKGKVKEWAGKATGDAKTHAEGKMDQMKGKVENAVGGAKDAMREKQNQD